jgi:hypothetical protein
MVPVGRRETGVRGGEIEGTTTAGKTVKVLDGMTV